MRTQVQLLGRGDSLAAFELSPVRAWPFPGEPAPAHDPQDYKYVNGFVDVGDLPCRAATWREVASRQRAPETDWPVEGLYLPGANRRVEFSQFRRTPTRLERWCRAWLASTADRFVSYRLSTCGGVHIWVDGMLAARFEPFTRNSAQSTVVHLPLSAAGSDVLVLTEEMAERDTNWFFELTQIDDVAVTASLPGVHDDASGSLPLARLAAEVRCAGDFAIDGPVRLVFDSPPAEPVTIDALVGSTSHDRSWRLERCVTLPAGGTSVELFPAGELPEGYASIALALRIGGARIERRIGCPILRAAGPQRLEGDLAARKRHVLALLADGGEMRMGTALAMLAAGREPDARFRSIIEATLATIEGRHDCADFVLVPLLWALQRYADVFPADLRERAAGAVLGFRYWVDEPGNDVMWFWSENHALCFHVSQLLAGALYPDAVFTASDRTGAEQHQLARDRLGRWFDAVEADGLAEWNSAAYYPVDFIGLLALAEFGSPALAERARAACDRIFTMTALHTTGGVPAGSMGRAYDKELRAGPLTELAPFATLAWGRGWLNRGVASLPEFAAGSYEPPEKLDALAWPEAGAAVTARYRQGHGEAARLRLFKTAHLQLSTNEAARAGGYGHQQHVVDLLFARHPFARVFINHPGEDDPWGTQRPSYWAGNGVLPRAAQVGNVSLVLYDLGEAPRLAFTHLHVATDVIAVEPGERRLILRAGSGVAAVLSTSELLPVTRGPTAGHEWRASGTRSGWAIIACDHTDTEKFLAEVAVSRLELADGQLVLSGPTNLRLDWRDGLVPTRAEDWPSEPAIALSTLRTG